MRTGLALFLMVVLLVLIVFITMAYTDRESGETDFLNPVDASSDEDNRSTASDRDNRRQELVNWYLMHICDIVPHDAPDYGKRVLELAEQMADDELAVSEEIEENRP